MIRGELHKHAYTADYVAWENKAACLFIAGLYAPADASADIMSSRTAQTEIRPRLSSDKVFYILNLLDQPSDNVYIDQPAVEKHVKTTGEGLLLSLNYIDVVLKCVEKVHTRLWIEKLPVVYFAGVIVQACLDRVLQMFERPLPFGHAVLRKTPLSGFFISIFDKV